MDNSFEKKIIKFLTGECSIEEQKEVEEWLKNNSDKRKVIKEYQRTWEITENLRLEENKNKIWKGLEEKISSSTQPISIHKLHQNSTNTEEKRKKFSKGNFLTKISSQKWLWGLAAVALLTLCISFLVYNNGVNMINKNAGMEYVVTDRGERMNITFSDGSSVLLNSSSSLRYPQKFSSDSRYVELDGEAFFSVAQKEAPFNVYANGTEIQVLGTKFNVNAFSAEDKVEVAVTDGKVSVRIDDEETIDSSAESVLVEKGEYTMVSEAKGLLEPRNVDLDPYIGWVEGKLVFEATPLDKVIKKLELFYGQDFKVSSKDMLDLRLTATFDNESLSKVLEVLSVAMDVEYKKEDRLIVLKDNS